MWSKAGSWAMIPPFMGYPFSIEPIFAGCLGQKVQGHHRKNLRGDDGDWRGVVDGEWHGGLELFWVPQFNYRSFKFFGAGMMLQVTCNIIMKNIWNGPGPRSRAWSATVMPVPTWRGRVCSIVVSYSKNSPSNYQWTSHFSGAIDSCSAQRGCPSMEKAWCIGLKSEAVVFSGPSTASSTLFIKKAHLALITM